MRERKSEETFLFHFLCGRGPPWLGQARNVFFCFINCLCHPAVSLLSPSCSFCFNSLCLILNSEGNNDHLLMVFIVHFLLTFLLCLLSLYIIFSGSDQRRDQRGRLQRVRQAVGRHHPEERPGHQEPGRHSLSERIHCTGNEG